MPEAASSLSAYLLARRLDSRPVSQEGIDGLTIADKAINEARRTLPYGRGNIDVDAQRTRLESGARTLAAKHLRRDAAAAGHQPMPEADEDMNWDVLTAMSGRVFGAGNCGEHSRIAAFAYGALAQKSGRPADEKIHLSEQMGEDHVWAEADTHEAGPTSIIMDPWANGPAVFAEDSQFAKDRTLIERTRTFDLQSAAEAGNVARATADEAMLHKADRLQQRLETARTRVSPLEGDAHRPAGRYRQQKNVLDETFAQRVRDRLNSADPAQAVQVELNAIGVAMSLGTEGVTRLSQEARKIVEDTQQVVSTQGMPRDQA